MADHFLVIQLTFAEIFVPQDFTILTTPGLSGPANTCAKITLALLPLFFMLFQMYNP